jgi:hypothetical protein
MAATVPEDLQISVGKITSGKNLNDDDSFLVLTDGKAVEPNEENMWSNIVMIDHYYSFGRLIPASSDKGINMFFTPDATAQGRNVKNTASYYQAANGLEALSSGAGSGSSFMATLHPKTANDDDWGAPSGTGYNPALSWSDTKDDGYYVDVPVWIRSSSKNDIGLTVSAYVKKGDVTSPTSQASGATVELYKATRVVILGAQSSGDSGTQGLIDVKDGETSGALGWASETSILDYYGTSAVHNVEDGAVYATGHGDGSDNPEALSSGTAANWQSIYRAYTEYNTDNSIATIEGSAGSGYGDAKLLWIRVWLEGEDPQCWNQNAGQDWNISLKFEKKDI